MVPRGRNFDVKTMITVGILRWLIDYQREEIQTIIEAGGSYISTGEISYLSSQFLLYFYCVQKRHVTDLRAAIGSYVLHLDGTGEAGNEIVFMAKDGRSGVTIDARTMPSEGTDYIVPFLEGIKKEIGSPCAIVRDMSESIRMASEKVFFDVLQIICQYHFVRNLGDKVFSDYSNFRNLVLKTKTLAVISKIRPTIDDAEIKKAESAWVRIAIEHILHPREKTSKFPFELPYVDVFGRCIEIKELAGRIASWNLLHNVYCGQLLELNSALTTFTGNVDLCDGYRAFDKVWEWFESIRNALRVGREMNSSASKEQPVNAELIRKNVLSTLDKITYEGWRLGGYLKRKSQIFQKQIDVHLDELVTPVADVDGNIIDVVRHNGVEELGHRWSRMHIRRRTGRSQTSSEMAMYGPLLAVVSNIENPVYIEKVLYKIDFIREISSITRRELEGAEKLIRPYTVNYMVRDDDKRKELLHELVEVMEKDTLQEHLKAWVSALQIGI